MIVLKFGGTSVANAERLKMVANIILETKSNNNGVLAIVSAFSGVTDLLIEATNQAEQNNPQYIESIGLFFNKAHHVAKDLLSEDGYNKITDELNNNHKTLKNLLSGVALIQEASNKTRDYILSFGERNSAFILSNYINELGHKCQYVDARSYIKTDNQFGQARVDFELTNKLIKSEFESIDHIGIVTGFIGSEKQSNRTTTLGRGGSDYSGAIFAAALNASELQIWTDVSGVLTSDPRKVKNAYSIKNLSYNEALEMSHFGAKVLYAPTIRPVRENNIPTRIKNTFDPNHPGTIINDIKEDTDKVIAGLSSINDISIISIEGTGLQGVSGTASRFFSALATKDINVIMITQASSEHSISVAVKESEAELAKTVIEEAFEFEIKRKLVDPIKVIPGLCLIAIIGENMKNRPGVAGKLFKVLGQNGINIEAIAQGSSELNITFAIQKEDESKALNTIHDSFFLSEYKSIHLYIVGTGLVGKTLLKQLEENHQSIKDDIGFDLIINGLSNSRKMVFNPEGITISDAYDTLEKSTTSADLAEFVDNMIMDNHSNSIFVDNTAGSSVPEFYASILKQSIAVSTPNKVALSSTLAHYKNLKDLSFKHNAPIGFETNVGAGLPVISTLKSLINSGDKIHKIEAVLSGSLSYIFSTFNSDNTFLDIVKKAKDLGYTEPDPREDLSGADVKRKSLILARESGWPFENEDIKIKHILSDEMLDALDVESFFDLLKLNDNYFSKLVLDAEQNGDKLRFVASISSSGGEIGLRSVNETSPFYNLGGTDNMIVFYTDRYSNNPLVIRGPGAGAEVTAAGILAEIISISNII